MLEGCAELLSASELFQSLARTGKDLVKHRFRELAGEGILLTWMEGGDQCLARRQFHFKRVPERRPLRL